MTKQKRRNTAAMPTARKRFAEVPPPPKPGIAGQRVTAQVGRENPYETIRTDHDYLHRIQGGLQARVADVQTFNDSEFPEIIATAPNDWEEVLLAPLYDAHIGSVSHDAPLFAEHVAWIRDTDNVLTWNGGDSIENANKLSPGSGVYYQTPPQRQILTAIEQFAAIRHKMLFSLSGNHEDRIEQLGVDVSEWIALTLGVPYFPGYCACRLLWRGMAFNILAHHGSGAPQTAGGQLNNIRRDLPWAHGFDLYWFGHLHRSIHSKEYRVMHDPRTGRLVKREAYAILSPSYLKYFGSYAEKKRLPPSMRGMAVVRLHETGRMDFEEHAAGVRF